MYNKELLSNTFGANHQVLHLQIDGLTHEQSMLQPPFRGNCLNWVLGHMVSNRQAVLQLLGEEPIWSEEEREPYNRGSEPIVHEGRPFDELVAAYDQAQERIMAGLAKLTDEQLAQTADEEKSLGQRLAGLLWHETYHTGQTEFLRQLTGVNDQVIP